MAEDHRIALYTSTEDIEEVVGKAEALLSQTEQYRAFLIQHRKESNVELGTFINNVAKEHNVLQRVKSALSLDITDNSHEARDAHQALRSSNLGYYLAVWEAAKNCTGLVCFQKRVYWETPTRDSKKGNKPQKAGAYVDITAQDGAEWVKVSTMTEKRLIRELAEKGYHPDDSPDEGELDEDDMVELVKAAHDLRKASKSMRVRYKHPQVRFVLPKIVPGRVAEVDRIIDQICDTGAIVNCGRLSEDRATIPLAKVFVQLLPLASLTLTETINVDCTILLALVSDLSHYDTERILHEARARNPGGTLKPVIMRQLEKEVEDQLVQTTLYPLLKDHDLVCTEEAAVRMREVVSTIGTVAEKERTALFMGDMGSSTSELHEKLSDLSTHPIPATLKLPIKIVPTDLKMKRLPPVAKNVIDHFSKTDTSSVTKSVFLYGWQSNITTISSNRTVAKAIESVIYEQDTNDAGPDVYLVSTSRSLVGKEKRK